MRIPAHASFYDNNGCRAAHNTSPLSVWEKANSATQKLIGCLFGIPKNRFRSLKLSLRMRHNDNCFYLIRAFLTLNNLCIVGADDSSDFESDKIAPLRALASTAPAIRKKTRKALMLYMKIIISLGITKSFLFTLYILFPYNYKTELLGFQFPQLK